MKSVKKQNTTGYMYGNRQIELFIYFIHDLMFNRYPQQIMIYFRGHWKL